MLGHSIREWKCPIFVPALSCHQEAVEYDSMRVDRRLFIRKRFGQVTVIKSAELHEVHEHRTTKVRIHHPNQFRTLEMMPVSKRRGNIVSSLDSQLICSVFWLSQQSISVITRSCDSDLRNATKMSRVLVHEQTVKGYHPWSINLEPKQKRLSILVYLPVS